METIAEKKTRLVYFDVMRIIAVYLVIFNHSGPNGFLLFTQREAGSVPYWVYLSMTCFCKAAVPLFFAISGALMLDRENEPLPQLWGRRICKYALIIIVFFFCNYGAQALFSGEPMQWEKLFGSVYAGYFYGQRYPYEHLWYLYAYIAFLICLPFLRSLVRNLDTKYFYYMLAIALCFSSILPGLELVSHNAGTLYEMVRPSWLLQNTVLYPCIGYFLEHRINIEKQGKKLLGMWMVNGTLIAISCYLQYYYMSQTGNDDMVYHEIFSWFNCITVFLTVKYAFTHIRIAQWLEHGIMAFGKCTFGIYLIHVMIQNSAPMKKLLLAMTGIGISNMLSCLIQCAVVMLIGGGITYVWLKIPCVRKLAGG